MTVAWVFDPAPPSGRRTGGSAAEYSFEGRIDTLVRETIQNSIDARTDGAGKVDVRFRLVDLDGEHKETFLAAIAWEGLEDNLVATPPDRGGRGIQKAIQRLRDERLRLLIVEDRGTKGLEGSDQRGSDLETNPFCALVRDELYSDKDDPSAAGSFGLGKSVLWAFSGLKTVLFASVPRTAPSGFSGVRFIGRTSLPWHRTELDGECSGEGWFGQGIQPTSTARRAESIWGANANRVAQACRCPRKDDEYGLSAVVVGFSEPGEEDRSASDVCDEISRAVLESFWPAIVDGRLAVGVAVEENDSVAMRRDVNPETEPGYRDLGALLRQYRLGELTERQALDAGEAGLTWANLDVPARLVNETHPAFRTKAAILVRVLEEGSTAGPVEDRIIRFRGRGMVVRLERQSALSLGARPFIAAVLAGEASGSDAQARRADQFLRAAEPPAHNEWTHNTRRIKQDYHVHGTKKKLDDFQAAIREAVAKLVSKPQEKGGQLPKALLKYLRFSSAGGGGQPRYLSVSHQKAAALGGRWRFSVRCRRIPKEDGDWHVQVRLRYARDGGGADALKAMGQVSSADATRVEIRGGVAFLYFPADKRTATIEGETAVELMPSIGTRSVLSIHVDGADGEIPDA